MSSETLALVALIFSIFFVAGIVKGITGMGLPTVAMGLIGALISPVTAASLLIVPSFVTNVWQLVAGRNLVPLLRRLGWMMVAVFAATVLSASLLTSGSAKLTTAALGSALAVYSLYTLLAGQLHISKRSERRWSPIIGATTGVVTGATGVFVIPAVPYLQALGFERDQLVQALGLSFTVSTIGLAIGLFWGGAFQMDTLALSSLAVIPALAGMWSGQVVRQRIAPAVFRKWFLLFLLVLGLEMMSRLLR